MEIGVRIESDITEKRGKMKVELKLVFCAVVLCHVKSTLGDDGTHETAAHHDHSTSKTHSNKPPSPATFSEVEHFLRHILHSTPHQQKTQYFGLPHGFPTHLDLTTAYELDLEKRWNELYPS